MELHYTELGNRIRLLELAGRLDAAGFNEIEIRFSGYCAGQNTQVIVDLARVSFLASIGIRLFAINARSLVSRGGKLVLLNPTDNVKNVLEMTGILESVPAFDSLETAQAAFASA